MKDLTGFQRDLLWIVAEGNELHGLGIKDKIEQYYDTDIHHGRMYPNLDELKEKGLIKKGKIDGRTKSYSITRRGRRELKTRCEWEDEKLDETEENSSQLAEA